MSEFAPETWVIRNRYAYAANELASENFEEARKQFDLWLADQTLPLKSEVVAQRRAIAALTSAVEMWRQRASAAESQLAFPPKTRSTT